VAGIGSWHLDIVTEELTWSEQTYRLFGIDRWVPLDFAFFMERVHPQDRAMVESSWQAALKGEAYDIEHRIIAGRQTRWVHEKAEITFDTDGSPLSSVGTVLDITERKQAEANQQFQIQLLDQIHDSVIATDMDGMITSWNKGSTSLFHYKAEDVMGKHVSMLYPEYSHAYLRDSIIPTLLSRGSHEIQTRLVRRGGKEFDALVSLSVLRDSTGATVGMIGYTLDITERERARKALADSERRLSDIIEFLPDPTWVIDIDERVIAWNRAVEKITGVKKDEILGKGNYAHGISFYGQPRPTIANLVLTPDEQWEKKYLNVQKENGILVSAESYNPKMGGQGTYLSISAARLYDANGNVVGAIQSIRDITSTKQYEKEREKLITDLRTALDKVRTLSGLLPICSCCKKIRDDRGYWNQIELYIADHTGIDFSHGICPDCAEKYYPDLDIFEE
jgi:PAS domain S-box-containing protein